MRKGLSTLALITLAATSLPAQAEVPADYPSAVDTFAQVCLTPGFSPDTRATALGELAGWRQDQAVTVDVAKFDISKTIVHNYSFADAVTSSQWSGTIDGKPAKFVLATFDPKSRYPNLCALVLEGVPNAMPYGDPLREAFKAYGVGGKSVDLVHYFEFAGKVGAEKHPVRGEVFSRSQVGSRKDTMHIYVAY